MNLIKPDFTYNFAGIPGSIARYFGVIHNHVSLPDELLEPFKDDYHSVCLIFIDAFGWRFLKQYTESNPLSLFTTATAGGQLTKITSQFPSTTAAHVTSINTGLPVWDSCIFEWHYYESLIDRVITPLPFTTPIENSNNSLSRHGVTGTDIFPEGWFYPSLKEHGIATQIFLKEAYTHSPFNTAVNKDASLIHFTDHRDGLQKLGTALCAASTPTYSFYYFEDFDSSMHRHGPLSTESTEVITWFSEQFTENVLAPVQQQGRKVLFIFTADHGMTHMNPETTRYIDTDIPSINQWIRTTKIGQPIRPVGSPRDLFLHIKPEYLDIAYAALQQEYGNIAQIFRTEDMINSLYFGVGNPSDRFKANIGDILIAPFAGESIYWLGPNEEFKQFFKGHHGGLTAAEMESIFLVYPS